MSDIQTSEILREWTESAPYWEKYGPIIRTMFAPVTAALIEDAGIREGQTVLDVAGGTGEPSLTIAETVGPSGSVVCTDAVADMVQAAERAARRHGITNVSFRQCSADLLPFDSDSFDVVVSRLGIMFFPDPLSGLREMRRITKPRGSLALAAWHQSELNPFCSSVSKVLSRYVETPPVDPDAPGAFRFAEPGKIANILRNAGAVDVRERILKFQIAAPISVDEFWKLRSATSSTLRKKLASFPGAQVCQVAEDVKQDVRGFFPNGEMSFPAQMIIVSGQKS
jgi:ubiquinone/menaquinone biosynthesis C-methylase UbiE